MPKIDVPLRKAEEITALKKNKKLLRDMAELSRITDEIKSLTDLAGELRLAVYDGLSEVLPEGEKSVAYDGHRFTAYQGEPRRTLDMVKLAKLIPAAKLEKCYKLSDPPRPTVQVVRLAPESQEERKVRKVTKVLKHGDE